MNVSNKLLGLVLVASIFISLFGAFMSIYRINSINQSDFFGTGSPTGYATNDTANVTLTVAKVASIRFVNSSCNWGSGSVGTQPNDYCLMETNGSGWINDSAGGCVDFSTVSRCLILENNGSAKVSVELNFSHNATDLLGLNAGALLQYNVSNNETNSCSNLTQSDWNDTTTAYEPIVCTNFSSTGSSNSLLLDFKVGFNASISQGQKLLNVTAYATSIE